jgi:hypothetical protein
MSSLSFLWDIVVRSCCWINWVEYTRTEIGGGEVTEAEAEAEAAATAAAEEVMAGAAGEGEGEGDGVVREKNKKEGLN